MRSAQLGTTPPKRASPSPHSCDARSRDIPDHVHRISRARLERKALERGAGIALVRRCTTLHYVQGTHPEQQRDDADARLHVCKSAPGPARRRWEGTLLMREKEKEKGGKGRGHSQMISDRNKSEQRDKKKTMRASATTSQMLAHHTRCAALRCCAHLISSHLTPPGYPRLASHLYPSPTKPRNYFLRACACVYMCRRRACVLTHSARAPRYAAGCGCGCGCGRRGAQQRRRVFVIWVEGVRIALLGDAEWVFIEVVEQGRRDFG